MSVGYDLEGIRTGKMQSFLDGLMDASRHELYQRHLLELDSFVRQEAAQGLQRRVFRGCRAKYRRAFPTP